jgi:enamine deaminase RidA (YjgF/YER057c/UK114 family)
MVTSLVAELESCPQVREVAREGGREVFLTLPGVGPEALEAAAAYLRRAHGATVVRAQCFAAADAGAGEVAAALPTTCVRGDSTGPALGGLHLRAVAGAEVTPLVLGGRAVGTMVTGPYAVEVMVDGIHAADPSAPRAAQARVTFEQLEQALGCAGLEFRHVARTWLYLENLLGWYDDFNRVRTDFFTERGIFEGVVPASTGIGGGNPHGAALVAGAYAILPRDPRVTVQALPSPLQCPALQYGSSFSRAVEVAMPDLRRVLVSGTASIALDGHSQHRGDCPAQVARTCEVVRAILTSRGLDWPDVTRAVAYVRHAEDAGAFENYRRAAGLPELPVLVAHNVVCRDDLLFELEVDATRAG